MYGKMKQKCLVFFLCFTAIADHFLRYITYLSSFYIKCIFFPKNVYKCCFYMIRFSRSKTLYG